MSHMNVLLIEDNPDDAAVIIRHISEFSENNPANDQMLLLVADDMNKAVEILSKKKIDVILLDLSLSGGTGTDSISNFIDDIPVIILTGSNNEKMGIEYIKKGARDYLVKSGIGKELIIKSIKYSCEIFNLMKEKNDLMVDLENAAGKIRMLGGFLPICSHCKKIRDDNGYWEQVEEYIKSHSLTEFTHSICPECAKKLYGNFTDIGE
jgi:CheY-like chemotaxis protein